MKYSFDIGAPSSHDRKRKKQKQKVPHLPVPGGLS